MFTEKMKSAKEHIKEKTKSTKEEFIVDDTMAMTLRVSRLYGIVPLHFKTTADGTYVYTSRTLYYLNITIILGISLIYLAFPIVTSCFDNLTIKSKPIILTSYLTNCFLCLFPLGFANIKGLVRIKCFLNCILYIYKIKKYVATEKKSKARKKQIAYIIGLEISVLWITELFNLFLIQNSISSVSSVLECFVFSALILMEIQFAVIALNINSIFKDIKEQLKRILSQLSLETKSDDFIRIKCKNRKITNQIPTTDINLAIDMMGHFKHYFQDNKRTPRLKMSSKIRVLNHSFVSTCAVIRKLNNEENVIFFFNIIVSVVYFVEYSNVLYKLIQPSEFSDSKLFSIVVKTMFCLWHLVKPMLLVEPCQHIQDELLEIRLLVGQMLCLVNSESDPLLDATDAFFQQLILNEPFFTVMGICALKRQIMSTIAGGATTMLLIFMET